MNKFRTAVISVFFFVGFISSVTGLAAKPGCPGHPSCKDDAGSGDIQLGSGNDVWPGPGDDNSGDDTVLGGDGNDVISGGDGNDILQGQAGDDELYGGYGEVPSGFMRTISPKPSRSHTLQGAPIVTYRYPSGPNAI